MDDQFSNRVEQLCKERGLTLKAFERQMHYSNGYIKHVTQRKFRPKQARLEEIARYFQVTPEWLLGEQKEVDPDLPQAEGYKIPLVGRVAAGLPIKAVQNIVDYEEISEELAKKGEYFALRIKGDSMSPYIMNGDIVIVRQQEDAESDEIVIALVNGDDGVCKKLKKSENALTLVSINPQYDPMVFTSDEVRTKPVKIVGKVVEIRRSL